MCDFVVAAKRQLLFGGFRVFEGNLRRWNRFIESSQDSYLCLSVRVSFQTGSSVRDLIVVVDLSRFRPVPFDPEHSRKRVKRSHPSVSRH